MMMWHYGFGWDFFPGALLWILFWVLIISFLWGRWHHRGYHHWDSDEGKTAEDILDERFAKGEINEEEYEKRLSVLRKHAK